MWAHIERCGRCDKQCGGRVRVFEDGQQFGDTYRYIFSFTMIDDQHIMVDGMAARAPTAAEMRAALEACHAQGLRVLQHRHSGARQGIVDITREKF